MLKIMSMFARGWISKFTLHVISNKCILKNYLRFLILNTFYTVTLGNFIPEQSRLRTSTNKSKSNSIAIFIRSNHCSDQSIRTCIFIYIWCINLLTEFRFFVIFIFSVNSNSSCSSSWWLSTIFGSYNKFIVGIITRVKIKLHKLWSIWVIKFIGHNCHFVQNSLQFWFKIHNFIPYMNQESKADEIFNEKYQIFDEIFDFMYVAKNCY